MTTARRSPSLPRGALKLATDALLDDGPLCDDHEEAARIALSAALPVIERAALKRAAERILKLQALSLGRLCPACHAKPVSEPHAGEGRSGYRCGCGNEWEPPEDRDWSLTVGALVKLLARGGELPELPAMMAGQDRGEPSR